MRGNEMRFRAMAQHVSDIVAVLNAEGRIMYSSPSATRSRPRSHNAQGRSSLARSALSC